MPLTAVKTIGMPAASLGAFAYTCSKTPIVLFTIAIFVIFAAFANCISLNTKLKI